jgi:hypothetical protein
MLKTQRWVPDTHPSYEMDTEWDHGEGGPTFVRCFRAAKDGVDLPNPDAVYSLILSENQTKNRALSALEAVLPDLAPVWVFGEADGVVHLALPGATEQQKLVAAAALSGFGEAVSLA